MLSQYRQQRISTILQLCLLLGSVANISCMPSAAKTTPKPSANLSSTSMNSSITSKQQTSNDSIKRTTAQIDTSFKDLGVAINEPSSAKGNGTNQQTDISTKASTQSAKPVKVASKRGLVLARMQGKRQADASGYSRRNEDPWFLEPQYPLQPYRFVYNVKGKNGNTEQYRQEVGDGKYLTGSYGYLLPDGIYRHVDYVADDRGFRAYIRTSEPGTANQNPADVVIDSNPVPVVPGVTYVNRDSSFPPANPFDYSTLRSTTELVRRPPGSIINTPYRNFTSYTFTPPPSDLSLSPFLRDASINNTLNNQRILAGDTPLQSLLGHHTTWGSGLSSSSLVDDSLFQRIRPVPAQSDHSKPSNQLDGSLSVPRYNPFDVLSPSLDRFPARTPTTPAPLIPNYRYSEPTRTGPSVLAYDRPLSDQSSLGTNKLSYDNNHIVHPDWHRLSLERARDIAHLSQYNRPLVAGTLIPIGGGLTTGGHHFLGRTSSETSREVHHKSQQEGLGPDFNRVTLSKEHHSGTKTGSAREYEVHKDPNSSPPSDSSGLLPPPPPIFPALQPAKSRASSGHSYDKFKGSSPFNSSYQQQQQRNEYLDQSIQQRDDEGQQQVTTVATTPSPLLIKVTQPREPVEPRLPIGSGESGDLVEDRGNFGTKTTSSTHAPFDSPIHTFGHQQHHENQQPTKGGGDGGIKGSGEHRTWPGSFSRPPAPVRAIRMPEAHDRTSVMMNDLRSMQNVIGLPQPPRSKLDLSPDERLNAGLNLADQIVTSRMNRLEALLKSTGPQSNARESSSASAGQAASVRQTVTVPNIHSKQDLNRHKQSITKRVLDSLTPELRKRISTGPLSKLTNSSKADVDSGDVLVDSLMPSNETFEAQRLSNKAKLQAEKVSELEKFQQRLRTQQLLLEHLKHPDKPANRSSAAKAARTSEMNAHIRYDEDNENAIEALKLLHSKATLDARDYSRLRRQNDMETTATESPSSVSPTSASTARTLVANGTVVSLQDSSAQKHESAGKQGVNEKPLSELAQHIQRWPSILNNKQSSKPFNNTIDSSLALALNITSKRSSPTEAIEIIENLLSQAPKSQTNKHTNTPTTSTTTTTTLAPPISNATTTTVSTQSTSSRPAQSKPSNTINLDFINSVTALSVDQMNPFAMSSVNPAVQRSSVESRLSPHKLETSVSPSSAIGVATMNARYSNTPEILNALDYHERRDTSNQLKGLIPDLNSVGQLKSLTSGWASNHRFGASPGSAPYMLLGPFGGPSTITSTEPSPVAAKLTASPTLLEANDTQPKTSTAAPAQSQASLHHEQTSNSKSERDGFEIRDSAIAVGHHKFYEVVSNFRHPGESAQFQAFRDPQLSIPVVTRR